MLSSLTISLLFFSSLFGGSEFEAPTIKIDSAFTCEQINQAATSRFSSSLGEMLDLTFRQVDSAYTGDKSIETYYRERLRGNSEKYLKQLDVMAYAVLIDLGSLNRYQDILLHETMQACLVNPKKDVLSIIPTVVNNAYQTAMTNPAFGICKAYNDESISLEDFIQFVNSSNNVFAASPLPALLADTNYGDEYLRQKLSDSCQIDPMSPLVENALIIARIAAAEADRKLLKEMQERQKLADARAKEQYAQRPSAGQSEILQDEWGMPQNNNARHSDISQDERASETSQNKNEDGAGLSRIFDNEIIGSSYSNLKSLAGAPHSSFGDTHTFDIDSCDVHATVENNKVTSLRLEITPQCQADLSSIIGDVTPIPDAVFTTGSFRATDLDYRADCLSMCGNAFDPSVYAYWTDPHTANSLEMLFEMQLISDGAIVAAKKWEAHMRDTEGEDYVTDNRFNCDRSYDDVAHAAFQNVPVNSITVGYRLTIPACLN